MRIKCKVCKSTLVPLPYMIGVEGKPYRCPKCRKITTPLRHRPK